MRGVLIIFVSAAALVAACGQSDHPAADTVQAWRQAVEAADLDATMALWAEDGATLTDPLLAEPHTQRLYIAASYSALYAVDGATIVTADPYLVDDGRTAAVEWVWTGPGFQVAGVSILVVDDGLIVSETTYYDPGRAPLPERG